MRRSKLAVSLLFVLGLLAAAVSAQTCIDLAGPNPFSHTQDFNALGNAPGPANPAGSNIVTLNAAAPRRYLGKFDGATNDLGAPLNIPGWALVEEGSNVSSVSGRYAAGDGSATGPNTYSFGLGVDRAFGSLTDDTHDLNWVGGCFTNTGTIPVGTVLIGFTGEMWRRGAAGIQLDTYAFQYAVGAANLYDGSTATLPYTSYPLFNFVTPNVTGAAGARDGNDPLNRVLFPPTPLPVALAPGETLYIRWQDSNIAGVADDALAIDDVTVSFLPPTAAPVVISGRVVDHEGQGIFRATIELDSLDGGKRYVMTNQFGRYRFDNVGSGHSYAITARAKGYTFEQSTLVIAVNESIDSANFTALEFPMRKAVQSQLWETNLRDSRRPVIRTPRR